MIIGLVLTVCVALGNGRGEDCDSYRYIVDTFNSQNVEDSIEDCMAEMTANQQTMGDRYLSCERVDGSYLIKRGNRSAREVLAELEKQNFQKKERN